MPSTLRPLALAGALLVLLAGCGAPAPPVPPVTPTATGIYQPGSFVWHDLVTADADAAQRFYRALFGWDFERLPSPDYIYLTILHDGRPIGGIYQDPTFRQNSYDAVWISYLSVPDVSAAADHTLGYGGDIYWNFTMPGRGKMAVVKDPQGAPVAYLRSIDGDPAPDTPIYDYTWLWNELWAPEPQEAVTFYQSLADYSVDETDPSGAAGTYYVLKSGDAPRAGVTQMPPEAYSEARWIPYVKVPDPAALTERVATLGGQVLAEPRERGSGVAALIEDPTGGLVAIQQWNQ